MDWFTIKMMSVNESYVRLLSSQIENELRLLHSVQGGLTVHYDLYDNYAHIRGVVMIQEQETVTLRKEIMEALAGVLAEHIMAEKELQILRQLIIKEFKYEAKEDLEPIEGYCKQFLYGEADSGESSAPNSEEGRLRRKQLLVQPLMQYLDENSELNLEGFLKFRVFDYLEELREIAEYAIDEFMMDRQYQEFISLLQYFVYIQEAKIPAAHLIHKGGHEFVILNDKLEPIDANEFDATFKLEVLEKDINFEDMIVSTLITVSPANIYIHTRDPEMTVIKTIRQIFDDRTTVCSYCRTCHTYLGEVKKQDQLSP
ncbi:putative sporulation protein YtxC [Paenibacillus sedimenti]|uniref:Sporulation protein YtxC n=1 Tax=Paenibacillus sedimenti TaxID=2770274 RepID=A0A926KN23_9BACL|nr:putative sporulation protein YtxC [Paenibacillus sedimenti]MBD0380133.1 putative sporulation protein YtxC [Paenibacillus sedimenti]